MKPRIIVTVITESGTKASLNISELSVDTIEAIMRDMTRLVNKLDDMIAKAREVIGDSK